MTLPAYLARSASVVALAAIASACAPTLVTAPAYTSMIGPDRDPTHYPCRFAYSLEDRGPVRSVQVADSERSEVASANASESAVGAEGQTTVTVVDVEGLPARTASDRTTRTERGWLLASDTSDHGIVISRIDAQRIARDVLAVHASDIDALPATRVRHPRQNNSVDFWPHDRVVAAEREGDVATVFTRLGRFGFASASAPGRVVDLGVHDAIVEPIVLVAAPEGYWLAVWARWVGGSDYVPVDELRFLHLTTRGSVDGEARARPEGTLDEASVRVENGELHASFAGAAGSAPHDLVVVPSATCMPPPSAPCDPRSRARTGDAAAPTATTVAATGVAATRDTDDASDTEGFRCAASTDGLSVVDAHGRPIWTRSGRFQRCALETLAERFVVVASSWSESSLHGGPLDVSVYVVARDSLELVARHEGVVRNLDAYLVRDGEGLWIGWMHLHDFEVVRLDALGARVGPVRTLGALYYEPRIEMRTGSDGPTLHWETEDAEGEIPFCSLGRVGE